MLTIALAKGRLLKSFIAYLESQGQNDLAAQLKSRERQLQIKVSPFHFLFVKGNDVPIYVEQGIADIGITGSDILNEAQYDVNQLLALPLANVTFQSQHLTRQRTITKSQLLFLKQQEIILKRQDVMSN